MANAYVKARTNVLVLREGKTIDDFHDINRALNKKGMYYFDMASPDVSNCVEDYSENKTKLSDTIENDRCFIVLDADIISNGNSDNDSINESLKLLEEVIEPGQVIMNMGCKYEKHRYIIPFEEMYIRDVEND